MYRRSKCIPGERNLRSSGVSNLVFIDVIQVARTEGIIRAKLWSNASKRWRRIYMISESIGPSVNSRTYVGRPHRIYSESELASPALTAMRLRTRIEHVLAFSRTWLLQQEPTLLMHSLGIMQTVEKLTKQCVMKWSPEELQIICAGENEGGVQIWSYVVCDMANIWPSLTVVNRKFKVASCVYSFALVWPLWQASLFADYRIQSNANNTINMEVSTEPLCQALRSAQSSPDVIIKLAKKNDFAVLTFDVQAVVSFLIWCW